MIGRRTPPIAKDQPPIRRLDCLRVFDTAPGELREGLAVDACAALFSAEDILLAVAGVPDPVEKEVQSRPDDQSYRVPPVG